MLSVYKTYEVTNTGIYTVGRGGYVFPSNTTVVIKASEYKIREFKSHKDLVVEEVSTSVKEDATKQNESSKYRINENGKLQCPDCDKDYKTEDGLEKHIQDKHGDA